MQEFNNHLQTQINNDTTFGSLRRVESLDSTFLRSQQISKTYERFESASKTKYKLKSKKEYFENHERIKQNKRLVQSIIDINKRKTNFVDILQHRKDGQNIYNLAGNNRSTFV